MQETMFRVIDGELWINGQRILKGWESFSGWYWFGVEKIRKQDSIIDGKVVKDDQIWYGLVQGFEEEWGEFSQGEIEGLGKYKVWPIPKAKLPISGRRN